MRYAAVVLAVVSFTACSPKDPEIALVLPESAALSELNPSFRPFLRATVEIEGVIGETPLAIDAESNRVSGRIPLNEAGTVSGDLVIRVFGRFGESNPEVLLARLTESVELDTTRENRPSLGSGFETDGGDPIFDANRNTFSNYEDLLAEIDPAPPAAFVNAEPESLQLGASVISGGGARQIIAVENRSKRDVNLWAFVSDAPGVYLSVVESESDAGGGPVSRRIASAEDPIVLSPFGSRFLAVTFAPPNSFFLTGAIILKARDPVSGVQQSREITLVGNADGRPQPRDPNYMPPETLPTVAGLETPLVLFPTDALFSGFPISNVDPVGRTSLRFTGNQLAGIGADAAYYVEVPPRYRFYAWISGLDTDVDLSLVPLSEDGTPEVGNRVVDPSSGPGPEAIQLDPRNTLRRYLLLLGVAAPELSEEERLELTDLPFQLTAHVVTGPDFDPVNPVDPAAGEIAGGETVTVRGSGFSPNVDLFFDDTEARVLSVDVDGTEITVLAPPKERGLGVQRADIRVRNPSEAGEVVQQMILPDAYAYLPESPRVAEVDPPVATVNGGTELRVVGAAFTDDREAPTVTVGGVAASSVIRVSDTVLLVTTPALDAGPKNLEVVVNFDVTGATSSKSVVVQDAFTVQPAELPAPTIESVCDVLIDAGTPCPALPRASEGNLPLMYIRGTGFNPGVAVRVGPLPASAVTVVDETLLEVTPPSNALGLVPVTVINPDGQSVALTAAIAYVEDCEFTPNGCPLCGNGRVEQGEDCDGAELAGATCLSQGLAGGTLSCASNCRFDTSLCDTCGNGRVDAVTESCDGNDLAARTCSNFGFSAGTLACTAGCSYDFADCRLCGNSLAEGEPGQFGAEVCDSNDLRGATCQTQGFFAGNLGCQNNCLAFDTSGCTDCGNGFVEGDEQCDGDALSGASCQSVSGLGGDLACSPSCTFDVSGCNTCGDSSVQSPLEDCDGADLAGGTCADFNFSGGTLACRSSDCRYDFTLCYVCGNGRLDPGEDCEGSNLNNLECDDVGFQTGTLACNTAECVFDFSGCSRCGDGTCNPEESYTAVNAAAGQCRTDCPIVTCGDGTCDGGNGEREATCPADCPWAEPFSVSLNQGNGLSGFIGGPLGGLLAVEVVDNSGTPVPGVRVTIEPPPGGHAVPDVATTDAGGIARTNPVLGLTPGSQTFRLRAFDFENNEIAGSPVDIVAQANDVADGTVFPVVNRSGVCLSTDTLPSTGAASATGLRFPERIALGPPGSPYADNLFITDRLNNRVLRMEPSGRMSLFAGGNGAGYTGDGGPATLAQTRTPEAITVGADGVVYIFQSSDYVVRRVELDGTISTYVGNGAFGVGGAADSPLATSMSVQDLAVDSNNTLVIMDNNGARGALRRLPPGGLVTRVYIFEEQPESGNSTVYYGMGLDSTDNVLLGTFQSGGEFFSAFTIVREIDAALETIAGKRGGEIALHESGPIGRSTFEVPYDIVYEEAGTILVADSGGSRARIWRLGLDGFQELLSGGASSTPSFDYTPFGDQTFEFPGSMALDSQGNLFIVDRDACAVFIVRGIEQTRRPNFALSISQPPATSVNNRPTTSATVTVTVDDAAPRGELLLEVQALTDGAFASVTSGLSDFEGTLDSDLWVGLAPGDYDFGAQVSNIEGVVASSQVTVAALTPASDTFTPVLNSFGGLGFPSPGPASQTRLDNPQYLESDADGTIFVSDIDANQIVQVSPLGEVSILAGTGVESNSGLSGPARLASFSSAYGLARVDRILYAMLTRQLVSIVLDAVGEPRMDLVAGNGGSGCGFRDSGGALTTGVTGLAASLEMSNPRGIAANPLVPGEIYIADGANPFGNGCRWLWQIAAGQATRWVEGRGVTCDPNGFFAFTGGVAVDANGDLYFGGMDVGGCNAARGVATPAVVYRLVSRNPQVLERIAGGGTTVDPNGIPARDASIGTVYSMVFRDDGALFLADLAGNRVYRVDNPDSPDPAQRTITTVVGGGGSVETREPVPRTDLELQTPAGIHVTSDGRLLIIDQQLGTIRALEP